MAAPRPDAGGRYSSRPETMYLDPEHVRHLYENMVPGGAFQTYAIGSAIDQRNETARLVRQWLNAGLVEEHKTREAATGRLLYVFRKRKPAPQPLSNAQQLPAAVADLPEDAAALLALIAAEAAKGRPCPSNSEIARRLGLKRPEYASRLIARLRARGLVRVRGGARFGTRVVEVVA